MLLNFENKVMIIIKYLQMNQISALNIFKGFIFFNSFFSGN